MEMQITEKLYDLKQLKKLLEENAEFLLSLIGVYLTTVPFSSKQMVLATETEDWLTVSQLAHKMKPTIDCMNITSIKTDIRTLETDGKSKVNTDILKKTAIKVDEVVNAVANQLRYEYNL